VANSVYSHDRPQEYPLGKPVLRVLEIPRPDKEFREEGAGIVFSNPGLPGRTFPPGYPWLDQFRAAGRWRSRKV